MSKKPRRSWHRRGCLLVVNLFWILLVLEVALRVVVKDTFPPRFFQADSRMGHFHVAGRSGIQHTPEYDTHIAINAKGLRDRDYPYSKPPGTFRILIMGDSFVEGFQVEEDQTFEARLEAQLNAAGGVPVEVINGGVSRYGTANDLLFWENEGMKYQPDLVIYAFYPNDVTDNIESHLFRLKDGVLQQPPIGVSFIERARGTLYDISYTYRLMLSLSIVVSRDTDPTLIKTQWGLVLPIYRAVLKPHEENAWELTAALLDRMQASVTESGATFVVLCLPEIFQSEDRLWAQVANSDEILSRDAPNRRLAQIISPETYFYDLLPDFRAVAQGTALYYKSDGHFNAAGHQLTADLLEAYLVQQGLIPTDAAALSSPG